MWDLEVSLLAEDGYTQEKGKINKIIDARGGEIAKEGENYVKAIDGNDLI